MPQTILPPTQNMPATTPTRMVWTKAAFLNLHTLGLLPAEGHAELIHGDIMEEPMIKMPHAICVTFVVEVLVSLFGFSRLLTNFSLWLDDKNIPQPDAAILQKPLREYADVELPRPADVILAVEVSVATLNSDITTKAALYADAGIVEYWVLDVAGRRLFVHRLPGSAGYDNVMVYTEHEEISPLFVDKKVFVKDMLP